MQNTVKSNLRRPPAPATGPTFSIPVTHEAPTSFLAQLIHRAGPGCISPDASLMEAARAMRMFDVDILLVGEHDRLVGAVTDRDIAVRAVAEGWDPRTVEVHEIMTRATRRDSEPWESFLSANPPVFKCGNK